MFSFSTTSSYVVRSSHLYVWPKLPTLNILFYYKIIHPGVRSKGLQQQNLREMERKSRGLVFVISCIIRVLLLTVTSENMNQNWRQTLDFPSVTVCLCARATWSHAHTTGLTRQHDPSHQELSVLTKALVLFPSCLLSPAASRSHPNNCIVSIHRKSIPAIKP